MHAVLGRNLLGQLGEVGPLLEVGVARVAGTQAVRRHLRVGLPELGFDGAEERLIAFRGQRHVGVGCGAKSGRYRELALEAEPYRMVDGEPERPQQFALRPEPPVRKHVHRQRRGGEQGIEMAACASAREFAARALQEFVFRSHVQRLEELIGKPEDRARG